MKLALKPVHYCNNNSDNVIIIIIIIIIIIHFDRLWSPGYFGNFSKYAKLEFKVIEVRKRVFLLPIFYKCQA